MQMKFSKSYKIQAVEKTLSRTNGTTVKEVASRLGVGYSTLQKWIRQSRSQLFESVSTPEQRSTAQMTKEKRPQEWSQEEKLDLLMRCGSLDASQISQLCREQGLYPHHVSHWKEEFISHSQQGTQVKNAGTVKALRLENKALKKELHRKDSALAETAALLVLQKKVNEIWGTDEVN